MTGPLAVAGRGATGAATVSFVPTPKPAAAPAKPAVAGVSPHSTSNAAAVTSNAAHARSFDACPGWVPAKLGRANTTAAPRTHSAAAPRRRPRHAAARTASAAHPSFRSGE